MNLAYTVILYPEDLGAQDAHFALMALSAGVLEAVERATGISGLKLKWPNDLYFGDRKLGGMLLQTALSGHRVQYLVFGVGINVNQPDFPPYLPNPVSIRQITGMERDPSSLTGYLHEALSDVYRMIVPLQPAAVRQSYLSHLYGLGEERRFLEVDSGLEFKAVVAGVDNAGRLHLRRSGGDHFYIMNTLKWI